MSHQSRRIAGLCLALALIAGCGRSGGQGCVITRIVDGDTLKADLEGRGPVTVRLEGIDCPEASQAMGSEATRFLAERALNREATLGLNGEDRYGRLLATVYVDGVDLNAALVSAGLAWHYVAYSDSAVLAEAEKSARGKRLGLWAQDDPTPPWTYRKARRGR